MLFSPSTCGFYPSEMRHEYEDAGTLPADVIEVTEGEFLKYGTQRPPVGMRRGADIKGRPAWVPIPPPSIESMAERKRSEIALALSAAMADGMAYTMPDGTEDVVQMMGEDRQNLMGLAIEARDLKADGVTDAAQEFRAMSNTRYAFTPDKMIDMTDAAIAHYKRLLQRSWDRKDAIDQALVAGDRGALESIEW